MLVDCSYSNKDGCSGGWPTAAWDYVLANKGLAPEAVKPYARCITNHTAMCTSVTLCDYASQTCAASALDSCVRHRLHARAMLTASWHAACSGSTGKWSGACPAAKTPKALGSGVMKGYSWVMPQNDAGVIAALQSQPLFVSQTSSTCLADVQCNPLNSLSQSGCS